MHDGGPQRCLFALPILSQREKPSALAGSCTNQYQCLNLHRKFGKRHCRDRDSGWIFWILPFRGGGGGSLVSPLVCSSSFQTLADVVRATDADPLNLLWAAKQFHDGTIFSGLIFISIIFSCASFLLLTTFPGWILDEDSMGSEREVKLFTSRPVCLVALACTAIAAIFSFISALWQHLSAAATISIVKAFGYGYVNGHVGTIAMVFGWGGIALMAVTMLG